MNNEKNLNTSNIVNYLYGFFGITISFLIIGLLIYAINYISEPKVFGRFENITLSVAGQELSVETVTSAKDMKRGLAGRTSLAENEGMLFVYDYDIMPRFWMKDMLIPIDIIWLKDNMIVGIEKNILPTNNENLDVYSPQVFVNSVLEVNAGFSDKYNLKIGDIIDITDK